jgi:uncharacterized membrane protein
LRLRPASDLVIVLLLSVLLVTIIATLPSNPLRVVLALPFILFFPGYVLVTALFPRRAELEGVERVALSVGLSVAVVPLIGLVLNYTPWGIALYPFLTSVFLFVIVLSGIATCRRQRLSDDERFSIRFNISLSEWTALGGWDRVLAIALVVLTLGAIGTVAYAAASPREGESYSRFYVVGLEGKAGGYPQELALGEEGRVILGITNNEHEDDLDYRVEIVIDGDITATIGPLTLDHEQTWEGEVGFTPTETGVDQRVEFLLYKNGDEEPEESLHLWVDVIN